MSEVDVPPDVDHLSKIVSVKGKDNFPEFDDGDLLVYREDWRDPDTMLGKRAVILMSSGDLLIGRVQNGTEAGKYTVLRINAPALVNAEVTGVTPITWTKPAY